MKILLFICTYMCATMASAQSRNVGYIFFDESSSDVYESSTSLTGHIGKKYEKIVVRKGSNTEGIRFYIGDGSFLFTFIQGQYTDTCDVKQLKNVKLLYDKDLSLLKAKYTIGGLGRDKIFKKLYIAEKLSSSTYVMYEVVWDDAIQ